jgi:hypothetical protein
MGRTLVGMAIASSIATVDEGHGARRGGHAPAPANDQQANGRLVNRDIPGLLAAEYRALILYSRRLTANGPGAVDILHMGCARVLSQRTPIEGVENPSGWLRTVLFHAFVDLPRCARWEIPTDSAALERPTNHDRPSPRCEPVRQVTHEDRSVRGASRASESDFDCGDWNLRSGWHSIQEKRRHGVGGPDRSEVWLEGRWAARAEDAQSCESSRSEVGGARHRTQCDRRAGVRRRSRGRGT